jgi:hypothetical protein
MKSKFVPYPKGKKVYISSINFGKYIVVDHYMSSEPDGDTYKDVLMYNVQRIDGLNWKAAHEWIIPAEDSDQVDFDIYDTDTLLEMYRDYQILFELYGDMDYYYKLYSIEYNLKQQNKISNWR